MDHEERERLTRVEGDVGRIKDDVRELKTDVQDIKRLLHEARGGWRVLVIIGGAGAAVGAFGLKVIDKVLP